MPDSRAARPCARDASAGISSSRVAASAGSDWMAAASSKPSMPGMAGRSSRCRTARRAAAARIIRSASALDAAAVPRIAHNSSTSAGAPGRARCRRRSSRAARRVGAPCRGIGAAACVSRTMVNQKVERLAPASAVDADPAAHQSPPAGGRSPVPARCRRTCASSSHRPARSARTAGPGLGGDADAGIAHVEAQRDAPVRPASRLTRDADRARAR